MSSRKKRLIKVSTALWLLAFSFIISDRAFALSSEGIFTRILVNNLGTCYDQALAGEIKIKEYGDFDSLMNDGYKKSNTPNYPILIPALNDGYNKITETGSDGGRVTSCYALFAGDKTAPSTLDGDMSGLFDIYGIAMPNARDAESVSGFMRETLKYAYDSNSGEASDEEYCFKVEAKSNAETGNNFVDLGSFCVSKDNYESLVGGAISFGGGDQSDSLTVTGSVEILGGGKKILKITVTEPNSRCFKNPGSLLPCSVMKTIDLKETLEEGTHDDFGSEPGVSPTAGNPLPSARLIISINETNGAGESSREAIYKKGQVSGDLYQSITANNYSDRVEFSDFDKYQFYLKYLEEYYGYEGKVTDDCHKDKPNPLVDPTSEKYYIYASRSSGWCNAQLPTSTVGTSHAMTVFTTDERYVLNKVINTSSELINLMGELNYEDPSFDSISSSTSSGTNSEPPSEPSAPTCMNSAGSSLAWILCPILEGVGSATEDIFNKYLEPALRVDPKLFSSNEDEGTRQAWGTFQNIANILFVILLLVVIFSQLTGYGIDNYGIKKILPKLIVAAILINLSYLICLIAVDLSNILGNGFQNFFNSIEVNKIEELQIGNYEVTSGELQGLSGSAVVAIAMVGIVVANIGPIIAPLVSAGAVAGGIGLLITLLATIISAFVAVFFLFLLFAAREALIVVLVVISPLAFACILLPNTKSLFDKWLKVAQGLLLVYPICGLLIGGGNFVSKLLLSVPQGTFGGLIAMIAGIVPIFFIPSVLKNSFTALGGIGAKLSGIGKSIGDKASSGAKNALEGSERYQKRLAYGKERRAIKRAERAIKGKEEGRFKRAGLEAKEQAGTISDYERRRLQEARRVQTAVANRELQAYNEQYSAYDGGMLVAESKNAGAWIDKDGVNSEERMIALIQNMEKQGKEDEIVEMLRENPSMKNKAKVMSALAGSKNKILQAYSKGVLRANGNGKDFDDFMVAGEGEGGLRDYIKKEGADFINGLDSKALKQIDKYEEKNGIKIIPTQQAEQAAVQLNDEDSMESINKILARRDDMDVSAQQFAKFNDSTIETILGSGNSSAIEALKTGAERAAADPQVLSSLSSKRIERFSIGQPETAPVDEPKIVPGSSGTITQTQGDLWIPSGGGNLTEEQIQLARDHKENKTNNTQ